jgi:hypothetical protein
MKNSTSSGNVWTAEVELDAVFVSELGDESSASRPGLLTPASSDNLSEGF